MGAVYSFGLIYIQTTPQLYVLSLINGLGAASLMAAYYSIFAHHVDHHREAYEWSLLSVGGLTISTAVGAALGGWAINAWGFTSTFTVAGALYVLVTIFLVTLIPYLKKE